MRKMFLLAGVLAITMLGVSCSKDNDKKEEVPSYQFKSTEKVEVLNVKAAKEIIVDQGRPKYEGYVKYSFSENQIVDNDSWDIAFKGDAIIVNGGTSPNSDEIKVTGKGAFYITEGTLESVTSADLSKFDKHALNHKDWGNYDKNTRLIKTIPGRIIIVRTHDGKYVKLRIDSYYKDKKEQQPGATYRNTQPGYFSFTFIKG